jgi:Zn-finger nucleic acid-binding protein
MAITVGQDIESICGKCGDVWHVVVAMDGGRIAKVVCKQCGNQHRHRPPDGAASASTRMRTSTSSKSRKRSAPGKKKKEKPADVPLVAADPSRPARSYSIGESFIVGDTIEHRTFGTGVVELVLEDRKIQVFFPDGRRVLAHQR